MTLAHTPALELLLDLVLAALLGGIIGAQRQATRKPAGVRTHLLVALGACTFMEISRLSGDTRIAAGVITGIGFLGAGAIVREGAVPHGLTTAASIWAVSAVGLALGYSTQLSYALAAIATMLTFGALSLTDKRLDQVFRKGEEIDVAVTFELDGLTQEAVVQLLTSDGVHVKPSDVLTIERVGPDRIANWQLALSSRHKRRIHEVIVAASMAPGLRRIAATELPSN